MNGPPEARPVGASGILLAVYPGRCPGLSKVGPLGHKTTDGRCQEIKNPCQAMVGLAGVLSIQSGSLLAYDLLDRISQRPLICRV